MLRKFLVIFSLSLLQGSYSAVLPWSWRSLFQLQNNFVCENDGFYPIAGTCSSDYYSCVGGIAYVQRCPGGAIFDPQTHFCTSPDKASCLQTTTTTTEMPTTTETTTTEAVFRCPSINGFFPIPGACSSEYYSCVNWVPYIRTCPGGAIFDPVTRVCTSSSGASCSKTTTTTTQATTTDPTTDPTTEPATESTPPERTTQGTTLAPFQCPSENGFFPVPGACSSNYYSCVAWIPYPKVCPGGALFDPVTRRCTSPQHASCLRTTTTPEPESTTSEPTTPEPTTTVPPSTEPTTDPTAADTTTPEPTTVVIVSTGPSFSCPGDGFFTLPGTCSGDYYTCINGIAYQQTCPGGGIFDPKLSACTSPDKASCLKTTTTTSVEVTTTEEPTTSTPFVCPANGFFAISGTCSNLYYICIDGMAYIESCPGTGIFDPATLVCTSPDHVSCQKTTPQATTTEVSSIQVTNVPETSVTPTTTEEPTTVILTTEEPTASTPFSCPENGFFAIPGACSSQFYICVDGTAYTDTCPGLAIFDPATHLCTPQENASCFKTTATTTESTTTETTTEATTITELESTTTDKTTQAATSQQPLVCGEDGFYPLPGQCSGTYYICVDGIAYDQSCPGDAVFDPELLLCTTLDNASCKQTTTTVATTTTKTPTTTEFVCVEDGMYAISETCSSDYYYCIGGYPYIQQCPNGTLFDPVTRRCTKPESASCYASTTTTTLATESTTRPTEADTTYETKPSEELPTTPFVCPDDGYYPISGTCSSNYYICVNGINYVETCPGQSVFDPVSLVCTSPENASCRGTTSLLPTSSKSTTVTEDITVPTTLPTTPSTPPTTVTPSTLPTTPSTPPTTVTPSTSPTTSSTTSSTIPSTITPRPTTNNPGCPYVCSQDGIFPGFTCEEYYICGGGKAYCYRCENGLVFNDVIKACDWRDNVPSCSSYRLRL